MKKIIAWIVKSSANSKNLSLTVKGALISLFSVAGSILIMFNFNQLPANDVNTFIESATQTIGSLLESVGYIIAGYGALRKIYLSIKK